MFTLFRYVRKAIVNIIKFAVIFVLVGGILSWLWSDYIYPKIIYPYVVVGDTDLTSNEDYESPDIGQAETVADVNTDISNETLHVAFIDVGQGDCTLVYDSNGNACLIDTGTYYNYDSVNAELEKRNIQKLNYMFLTHPDADHIGSADCVIENFSPDKVIVSNASSDSKTYQYYKESLINTNTPEEIAAEGKQYTVGNAVFTILAPESDCSFSDSNSHSLVIRVSYGNNSFLLMGDATGEELEGLMASNTDLKTDVYHTAHHGSANDGCNDIVLINRVAPEYAVISCGEGNSYGHPHYETMDILEGLQVPVYRTDKQGTIEVTSDGTTLNWSTSESSDYSHGGN